MKRQAGEESSMSAHIPVPTDFSASSEAALAYARELANQFGADRALGTIRNRGGGIFLTLSTDSFAQQPRPRRRRGVSSDCSRSRGQKSSVSNAAPRVQRTRRTRDVTSGLSGRTYTRISE